MDYKKIMKDLREDHDLTQEQVARLLGSPSLVGSEMCIRDSELPIRHLITLCRYYHITADHFLGLDRPEE